VQLLVGYRKVPLHFVIYINDIDININNVILKFADDTKIFSAVTDTNAIESLRSDLRRLYEWSNDWLMLFNIDKCKVLHFGSNNAMIKCWVIRF